MLIQFEIEDNLFKTTCSCGEEIYAFSKRKDLRCIECLRKEKHTSYSKDIDNRLKTIIKRLCEGSNL